MRIVAGRHRGRALAAPGGVAMRPTADRVREALFNVLVHGLEVELEGASVLDIFAGTGALGLEALSRGAAQAVFVDMVQASLALIRDNVATLGEEDRVQILRRDATRLGSPPAGLTPAGLAFLDPPYGENLAPPALAAAAERGWVAPGAICVVETRRDEDFVMPEGFTMRDERTYGGTRLYFLAAPE
jgi:16S rRNA (guanine966-N2)-methyltransferase